MVQRAADRKAEVDAEATAIKAKEAAAETKAAQLTAEKQKKAEGLKALQDERAAQEETARTKEVDEILETETRALDRATRGLHQAREERTPRRTHANDVEKIRGVEDQWVLAEGC